MKTVTQVRQALKALPNTPGKIARKFRDQRITGYKFRTTECPVTVYLKRIIGEQEKVEVDFRVTLVSDIEVVNPKAVTNFIRRFDSGKYRKLDKGEK